MTLEQFIADEALRIQRFADHWRRGQEKNGKEFWPDDMAPGEWDEQYLSFIDGEPQ